MFDIGFTELLLIGLVALFVLGPERLPGAVRTAGLWIGRAKRSFANIKSEVEREIGADEIRRQLHNERILDLEREMKQSIMPSPPGTGSSGSPQSATPAPDASAPGTQAVAEASPSEAKPAETAPVSRPDRPAEP
ncbi:Sec-independent protein translocase protein TatB [Stutzerimonas stutzeri]|uniref:Sec-independent protein translocase protein TatB n=1 Tax=Stutzerimonas stutzeri TaxID=316 RepID=A0A6I6LSX8_STUST|nr:Sec-independent protein translocase protein TatB [Stutzerimonas stutzeri]QGZ29421.1 Sec-independent protein translocase subunit TatB [Stutzerimonas stutzeri]